MYYHEQEPVISEYRSRLSNFETKLSESQKQSSHYSYIRLAIFLLSFPIVYFLAKIHFFAVILGLILLVAIFLRAVLKQQKYDNLVNTLQSILEINKNEINAIKELENNYYVGSKFEEAHHLYSSDLDIFGENSLFALINRCKTYDGIHDLSEKFLILPSKQDIIDRQESVKELAEKLDWRQDFSASLYDIENGFENDLASKIDDELKMDLSFAQGKLLDRYRILLPFIWIAVIVLYFVDLDMANTIAPLVFFFNLLLTIRKSKETTNVQNHLSYASIMLRSYKSALDIIFSEQWRSKLLVNKVNFFKEKSEKSSAVEVISQLQSIIEQLDYRLNLIPAILLNGLILWDFRVVNNLGKWKRENKGKLNELFKFIGEMESISSLANWAYNYPHFTFAKINEEYFHLQAIDIQHPLIPAGENVGNDFAINEGDHLNIITGSNMSGKSTLLRTIGTNMILAYTGAPIAAKEFTFPLVTVVSYMRIKDILEESVSTFKAELNRIQLILNMLKTKKKCFILIDEMLRGTNSKDKLTGSIGIARRLHSEKTYAMIATHDIKLAELSEEIKDGIKNYYFDIDYADGDLVFDYKVKEGICQNFNASFLLGQLGIEMKS